MVEKDRIVLSTFACFSKSRLFPYCKPVPPWLKITAITDIYSSYMSRPPHTKLASASLMTSFSRRPLRSATRTETNTDISGLDMQSLRTLDQLSTAQASVTMLDKLWTQIDVLDDVKNMARDVKERGSYFSEDFSKSLGLVKESQLRLLEVMNRHHVLSETSRQQQKAQHSQKVEVLGGMDEEGIKKDSEMKRQKMHDFFYGKDDADGAQRRDFDELNEYVRDVHDRLADVGENMKNFDDVTRQLW